METTNKSLIVDEWTADVSEIHSLSVFCHAELLLDTVIVATLDFEGEISAFGIIQPSKPIELCFDHDIVFDDVRLTIAEDHKFYKKGYSILIKNRHTSLVKANEIGRSLGFTYDFSDL